jgi:hypothetical protein
MAKQPEQAESAAKRSTYPYYGLRKSLEIATAVRDLGGVKTGVQKSVLAHQLGVDENSAAFKQQISAVKSFGLLEGWGTYTLTDIAKEYFYPTDDGQKRRALLKALKSPSVFAQLIDRFDGSRLPAGSLLTNVIHRDCSVTDSWAQRVAALFVGSLREAGVVDSAGFVRYDAAMHSANGVATSGESEADPVLPDAVSEAVAAGPAQRPAQVPVQVRTGSEDPNVNVWQYSAGGVRIRLETTGELPLALWKKLDQVVQVLKPLDPEGGAQ